MEAFQIGVSNTKTLGKEITFVLFVYLFVVPPLFSSFVLAASCYVTLSDWLKTHDTNCVVAILLPLPSDSWNHQVPLLCFVSWFVWVVAFWVRLVDACCTTRLIITRLGPVVPSTGLSGATGITGYTQQAASLRKMFAPETNLKAVTLHFRVASFLFSVSRGLKRCMCVHAHATKRQYKLHISIS